MTVTTHSREETQALAAEVATGLAHAPHDRATVLTLRGDLGAGKTTFTQGLLRALGVTENVTSPTFVLVQRYALSTPAFDNAYHIDAYRLGAAVELETLGLSEPLTDKRALLIVEWPEVGSDLFIPTIDVAIAHGTIPEERTITVTSHA